MLQITMPSPAQSELISILVAEHLDHGKNTAIARKGPAAAAGMVRAGMIVWQPHRESTTRFVRSHGLLSTAVKPGLRPSPARRCPWGDSYLRIGAEYLRHKLQSLQDVHCIRSNLPHVHIIGHDASTLGLINNPPETVLSTSGKAYLQHASRMFA